ncbi:MAG: aminotransferase DegT [Candidatus Latescibacterota bacterium]|nr:MAG: aminotransferase DegT [Candidatus Latescibacterota bacterium]
MLSSRLSENKWALAHSFGTIYGVEEARAMMEVLEDWAPTCGRKVKEFEERFAAHEGAKHAIAANSWVGAAHLVAIVLDIKPGDEIVVPAITFHASANIFVREGAKIVFAESDPRTFNLDPEKLEEKITSRTKAIVAVHMCGQPCDMDPILRIARRHNVKVIQDAAHAPGAEYRGKKLGEMGDFVIYSFQQCKNMSTLGEGGMVVTNDDEAAEKMRKLRSHGGGEYPGINSRMTDVQGAVGLVQLARLDRHNEARRKLAYYLNELLEDVEGITTPYEIPDVKHVYHLYNTLVDEKAIGMTRDEFIRALWEREGIKAITQYHPTVNCLPAYRAMGHGEGECPVSEETASKIVTLPLCPRFTESDMEELVEGIKRVIKR